MTTVTVESLAAARRLDPALLREWGVADLPGGGVSIEYRDKDRQLLFTRKRDVPDSGKRFLQPYRKSLCPYGLDRLADVDVLSTLYLTEGESDAWALWSEGFVALGIPGDNAAGCLDADHLAGVEALMVCLDEGVSGATFRAGVAKRLGEIGFTGRAWALSMPQGVKDVSDLRTADVECFDDRWDAVKKAASLIHPPVPPAAAAVTPVAQAAEQEDRPIITRLADVQAERITWLWQGWLPDGCLCVLDGDPGLGKSSLTLDLAARLSRGDALPPLAGRDLGRKPAATLLLGAEDPLKYVVRPRLDAMGADVNLIHALEGFTCGADDHERLVVLPRDLDRVEGFIRDNGVRLVVVDPLMAFLGADTDAHKDQDVRRVLRPLAQLADRLHVVVLLVRHLNKLSGGPALYRGGSSIGITGAARASLLCGRDPETDRFVVSMNKLNVGPKPTSLAYRLEGAGLASRVVWDGECDLRPDQILGHGPPRAGEPGQKPQRGRPPVAIAEAKQFLADLLSGGRVETREVMRLAAERQIAPATLDRARAELGVMPSREGKTYFMALPTPRPRSSDEAAADGEDDADASQDEDDGSDTLPFA